MQLPVDIPKLLAQVSDIEEARTTPLSISLYLDETAPVDVVAHVRSAFASSVPTVRMTISYVGAKPAVPYPADDMAVIVAGLWDGAMRRHSR